MSNSLNLANIKSLIAAAYLTGVNDAFEKSKGLDTYSLQKNIEDAKAFQKTLINNLKENGVATPESILINAKAKSKALFCEKYPDESKCKALNSPTNSKNKKESTGFLSAITSLFTSKAPSVATNVNSSTVNSPNVNSPKVNSSNVNSSTVNAPKVNSSTVNSSTVNAPRVNAPRVNNTTVNAPRVNNTTVNAPRVNAPRINNTTINVPRVNAPPPSVTTVVSSPTLPNTSALNPMIQAPLTTTLGGKRKSN
jgi:hypothetical protein